MGCYTIQNNSILTADKEETLTRFYENVYPLPDDYEVGKYIIDDVTEKLVPNPSWEKEQADKREIEFKSRFFNIGGYGWYRKQPKGYQSAIESLNTAFNRFTVMQKMGIEVFPANVFIFYAQPDFTKPEECTEEWLIEHQIRNEEMTVQEFGSFYATFTDAWNTEEHENIGE